MIAFASNRDVRGMQTDIVVMSSDGANVRNLTASPDWDGEPAWSPDGRRLAFASAKEGDSTDIYVMGVAGPALWGKLRRSDDMGR